RLAQTRGPERRPAETWREWIFGLPDPNRRSILVKALAVFEKSKYGGMPASSADFALLEETIKELKLYSGGHVPANLPRLVSSLAVSRRIFARPAAVDRCRTSALPVRAGATGTRAPAHRANRLARAELHQARTGLRNPCRHHSVDLRRGARQASRSGSAV